MDTSRPGFRVLPDRLDAEERHERSTHRLCPGEPLRPEPGAPSGGASLRDAGYEDDSLLPHLSPLGWEHINLAGDYSWQQNKHVEQGDFRPLPPLNQP